MTEHYSLRQRVEKGGKWIFLLKVVETLMRFVKLTILARILAPSDFGIMGIALATLGILDNFSRTGFHTALIQKKEKTEKYLDAAWTIAILRGFLLFLVLFISAPYAALFFNSPQSKIIIQALGIIFLIRGTTNIGVIFFRKELDFGKQFLYRAFVVLGDFISALIFAFLLRSVWALVLGFLIGESVGLISSYILHPYKPKISFESHKTRELFKYGKWVLGANIFVFLVNRLDTIIIGKFLGTLVLGYYQLAYRISNMSTTEFSHVISQITFPAYSILQDNLKKLGASYLKVFQFTFYFSVPLTVFIIIFSSEFTEIFLGTKWMPIVPAMQILAVAGGLRSIGATTGPVFYSLGLPKIETRWQILRFVALAVLIYPFTMEWGIKGASFSVLISALVYATGVCIICFRRLSINKYDFFKVTVLPISSSLIVTLIILGAKKFFIIRILELVFLGFLGVAMYLFLVWFIKKLLIYIFNIKFDYLVIMEDVKILNKRFQLKL